MHINVRCSLVSCDAIKSFISVPIDRQLTIEGESREVRVIELPMQQLASRHG